MKGHLLLALIAATVFGAVTAGAEQEKQELPPSGTLSTQVVGGMEGVEVPGVWGETNPLEEERNPISGSVSRIGTNTWQMRLFNNTEDKYRVTVRVSFFDKRGRQLKSNNYSYTLDPGETRERVLPVRPGTEQASLKLASWKNLTPPKADGQQGNGATGGAPVPADE